jgi:hypothetical protein
MKAARKKTKAAAAADHRTGRDDDRRARSLVTPEGVDLKLRLGDAGERAAGPADRPGDHAGRADRLRPAGPVGR